MGIDGVSLSIDAKKNYSLTKALENHVRTLVNNGEATMSGGSISSSEWNATLKKLAELQQSRNANNEESIFRGGATLPTKDWNKNFVVYDGDEINFTKDEITQLYEAMGISLKSTEKAKKAETPAAEATERAEESQKKKKPVTVDLASYDSANDPLLEKDLSLTKVLIEQFKEQKPELKGQTIDQDGVKITYNLQGYICKYEDENQIVDIMNPATISSMIIEKKNEEGQITRKIWLEKDKINFENIGKGMPEMMVVKGYEDYEYDDTGNRSKTTNYTSYGGERWSR